MEETNGQAGCIGDIHKNCLLLRVHAPKIAISNIGMIDARQSEVPDIGRGTVMQEKVRVLGDPAAWVDEHGDSLFQYAVSFVSDATVAEDLVQETFLAGLSCKHTFAGRSSERTWLVGILRHKIFDHYRRIHKEMQVDNFDDSSISEKTLFLQTGEQPGRWDPKLEPRDWQSGPYANLEQEAFWEIISECLLGLNPRLASAFKMREIEDMDTKDICATLSISEGNLWVMLHRARLWLRQCVESKWLKKGTMAELT